MITNPAAAMRMLITYAICIPVAVIIGYLLANPMDYGTLGFLGLAMAFVLSPIFIKWHYPIMVFSLGAPIVCFFLIGQPPLVQVMVFLSLAISIVERATNSDRQFIRVTSMTWPLLFLLAVIFFTMKLTGGFGLHTLGGSTGGGKKYIQCFASIAIYFALTSRAIPRKKLNLYLGLIFLPALLGIISDLFPYLPSPLNYINILIPPSGGSADEINNVHKFGAFAGAANAVIAFMLAKYGLRGIVLGGKLWRPCLLGLLFIVTLLGGFRNVLVSNLLIFTFLFFLEGLHHSPLLPAMGLAGVLGIALLIPFGHKLPITIQRSMCVLPGINWDSEAVLSAEGSSEWRLAIWRDTWPKVPHYLLLGKGYALTAEDYEMMGQGGGLVNGAAEKMDASENSLAISMDYHSGPLSTLMPFGLWGGIAFIWIILSGQRVLVRNYKYGDPACKMVNTYLLAAFLANLIGFLFVFGNFSNGLGGFTGLIGLSIAFNWGVCVAKSKPRVVVGFKSLTAPPPATSKNAEKLKN
jgi:hypothetical protein